MAFASQRGGGYGHDRRGCRGHGSSNELTRDQIKKKAFIDPNFRPEMKWAIDQLTDIISNDGDDPVNITNQRALASYNWNDDSWRKKIVVPGAPKEFRQWQGGDLSRHFNEKWRPNEELDRIPLQPLEPLFTSVRICKPHFRIIDYDIVADMHSISGLFDVSLEAVRGFRSRNGLPQLQRFHGDHSEGIVRINVQVIGSTLLMVRTEAKTRSEAGGVGLAFRRECGKPPPSSQMRPNTDESLLDGPYKIITEIQMGNLKLLLSDEVVAATYPTEFVAFSAMGPIPEGIGIDVSIGGYKGNLNSLVPMIVTSRSARKGAVITHAIWLHQFIFNYRHRYVGFHQNGVFQDPPSLKTLDQMQELCGLDDVATKLWPQMLHRILEKIVDFARGYRPNEKLRSFVVIADTESGLEIYGFENRDRENIQVVSENTLRDLMATVD